MNNKYDDLKEAIKNTFSIDIKDKSLVITDVEIGKTNGKNDWEQLNESVKTDKTIGKPIKVTAELFDNNTGELIDKKKFSAGLIPIRNIAKSYTVEGNNYSIPAAQFRLKSGGFGRISAQGNPEVFNNVNNGVTFRTEVNNKNKKFSFKIKQGNYPALPLLRIMGISDNQFKNIVGDDIYKRNLIKNDDKIIFKLHKSLTNSTTDDIDIAKKEIKTKLEEGITSPKINKGNLGTSFSTISGDYLLSTIKKVKDISNDRMQVDNRDHLKNKEAFSSMDLLGDYVYRHGLDFKNKMKIKNKLANNNEISKIINKKDIERGIKGFFNSSNLSRYADQTNPMGFLADASFTTVLGEGGIRSANLVPENAKELQNSHMGVLDMSHTSQSKNAGINLYLARDTKVEDKTIKTRVIDVITGKEKYISLDQYADNAIAFPGEFKKINGQWKAISDKVYAVKDDTISHLNPFEIKYMLYNSAGMSDTASNIVPFSNNNQGNRMLTSTGMAAQAISLLNKEKPLVDVEIDGVSILDEIGKDISVSSKRKENVIHVSNKEVITMGQDGNRYSYKIPRNIPLNNSSFIDFNPIVKKGDKLKSGDIIADSNFTKDGKYAIGTNLTTIYAPWKGINYEDSVVISEDASEKLTSEHMYKKIYNDVANSNITMDKFRAYYPFKIKEADLNKFDNNNIIKKGTKVKKGDVLIPALKETIFTPADNLISKLKKASVSPFKDNSLIWDKNVEGEVIDTVQGKDGVKIYVKTSEKMKVGDKLVGRHGNKATVGYIIPRDKTPITASGEKVDLIFDPLAVHPRINLGQVLETAAGKLAYKTNSIFKVENFSGKDYINKIKSGLAKEGLSSKEDIFDPDTGKTIHNIATGKQYIYKLKQKADSKGSSRGITGPYSINHQPTAGKGTGGMSIGNLAANVLMAHGAKNFIRDSFSIKNNPNTDYWRSVISGEIPPAPQTPYEHILGKEILLLLTKMGYLGMH